MMKNNKKRLVITSIVILLPTVATLLLWNWLDGVIQEKYISGANGLLQSLAIFPVVLLALQWGGAFLTLADPKNKEHNKQMTGIALWIVPFLSVFVYLMMINIIVGDGELMEMLISPVFGIAMIVIGNYMPKTTRNSTMGVKIKWTLENDDNWYATHRFSGKLQVACGVVICFGAFLPILWQMIFLLAVVFLGMVIPTTVYSYLFYKKQVANGTYVKNTEHMPMYEKKYGIIAVVGVAAVLGICTFLTFTGDINITLGDSSVDIEASFGEDLSILYSDIDSIEYREQKNIGVRIMGFNSARLSIGNFKNDEFGSYMCYAYNASKSCIIIKLDEKILLLTAEDEISTKALYDQIALKTSE